MKAVLSLFFKRGFRRNFIDLTKQVSILLGGIFTFSQIMEQFLGIHMKSINFLVILIIVFTAGGIILFFQTKSLLTKTFHLKDHYKITIAVDDYIDNAKKYAEATLVTGINNEFNVTLAKENSLQHDIVQSFFPKENKNSSGRTVVIQKKSGKTYLDENHDHRSFTYEELLDSITYKVSNYEEYNLKLLHSRSSENKRLFEYGSIIGEKFKYKRNIRRVLLFANSQHYGSGEFKGEKKTPSIIKLIWDYLYENNLDANPLLIPLLGTGHSKDATPMTATIAIIDHFFKISYPTSEDLLKYANVVPHLVISIRPEHIVKNEIDLLAVHQYIEVMNSRLDFSFRKKTIYKKIINDNEKKAVPNS